MSRKFRSVGFTNIPSFINSQNFHLDHKVVLATIYGYSQKGVGVFRGSYDHISNIISRTRRKAISVMNELEELNLVIKVPRGANEKNEFLVNDTAIDYLIECERIREFYDPEVLKGGNSKIIAFLCSEKYQTSPKIKGEICSPLDEKEEVGVKSVHPQGEICSLRTYTNTNTNNIKNTKKGFSENDTENENQKTEEQSKLFQVEEKKKKEEKESCAKEKEQNQNKVSNLDDNKFDKQTIESFNKFESWLRKEARNVNKMSSPFTIDEFYKLNQQFSKKFIADLILAMDNHKPLNKKNISAYRTFLNWAKRSTSSSAYSSNRAVDDGEQKWKEYLGR